MSQARRRLLDKLKPADFAPKSAKRAFTGRGADRYQRRTPVAYPVAGVNRREPLLAAKDKQKYRRHGGALRHDAGIRRDVGCSADEILLQGFGWICNAWTRQPQQSDMLKAGIADWRNATRKIGGEKCRLA